MPDKPKRPIGRPRKGAAPESTKHRQAPTAQQIDELSQKMLDAGEAVPDGGPEKFREWLKRSCEKELWFLSRWLLELDWLGQGRLHREEVCPFLTNVRNHRYKLLMLPMGHLKTSCASRAQPIHILIQPASRNMYFPGRPGSSVAIALASETETRSKENLGWISDHFENNEWLWWCWPEVVWENPRTEAKRWSDQYITVKRPIIKAEASITAIGADSGSVGRHWPRTAALRPHHHR
jgi:hypothetical protein